MLHSLAIYLSHLMLSSWYKQNTYILTWHYISTLTSSQYNNTMHHIITWHALTEFAFRNLKLITDLSHTMPLIIRSARYMPSIVTRQLILQQKQARKLDIRIWAVGSGYVTFVEHVTTLCGNFRSLLAENYFSRWNFRYQNINKQTKNYVWLTQNCKSDYCKTLVESKCAIFAEGLLHPPPTSYVNVHRWVAE